MAAKKTTTTNAVTRGGHGRKAKSRTPYDQLALLPYAVADAVCMSEYTGQEVPLVWGGSMQLSRSEVAEIERLRQKMTMVDAREFADLVDTRCRAAYKAEDDWFEKCVKGGNRGRDQLHIWVQHWLSSYLKNPARFRRDAKAAHARSTI